jgi:mxaC protein
MNLSLAVPSALFLLPLALLPLFFAIQRRQGYPSLAGCEMDPLSFAIEVGLRLVGAAAIVFLILGIGGLQLDGQTVERVGEGAHIVLLIDRSRSMDDTFAGKPPGDGEASKSAAARHLLRDFVLKRPHDRFGVAAFSTMPMHVLPLTDHKDAVLAAVDAITRPGLAYTNVGLGLAMALSMHEADPSAASRSVVLVSDGAAVIDRRVQEKLRAAFAKRPVNLYWLYLRTEGSPGIFDEPPDDVPDTPYSLPERHLNKFFESLKIPYRAFEAENPRAVADAIAEIDKLERNPISYSERIPGLDLSALAYALAAAAITLLLLAKLAEVDLAHARRLRAGLAHKREKAATNQLKQAA